MVVVFALLAGLGFVDPEIPRASNCLWEAVGPTQRQAWLSQYDRDPAGLMKTVIEGDRAATLAAACQVPAERVRHLLVARVLETGAATFWDRDMQRPGGLEQSWAALSEDQRAQFRRWAATAIDDGDGEELDLDGLPAFGRGAGLQDPNGPGMTHLMGYMLGRGYRELTGG